MDAVIAYAARTSDRSRYYVNDHIRDLVPLEPQLMQRSNEEVTQRRWIAQHNAWRAICPADG